MNTNRYGFEALEQEYGVHIIEHIPEGVFDVEDASGILWFTRLTRREVKRDVESFGETLKRIKENHARLEHSKREVDGESRRDRIERILAENDVWVGEIYDHTSLPVTAVEVNWGDWKHDHARVDYILGECGFTKMTEHVTEEDGSDCYSSIHYYA